MPATAALYRMIDKGNLMESTDAKKVKSKKSLLIFFLYLIPVLGYTIISVVEAFTFDFFLNGPIFFLLLSQVICSIIIGIKIGSHLVAKIFLPVLLIIGFHSLSFSILPSVNQIQIPVFSYRCNSLFDYNELERFRIELVTGYKNGSVILDEEQNGYRRPFLYTILDCENSYVKENFTDVGYYLRDGEIKYLIFFVAESKYTYAILWYPNKDKTQNTYGISSAQLFTDIAGGSCYFPLN